MFSCVSCLRRTRIHPMHPTAQTPHSGILTGIGVMETSSRSTANTFRCFFSIGDAKRHRISPVLPQVPPFLATVECDFCCSRCLLPHDQPVSPYGRGDILLCSRGFQHRVGNPCSSGAGLKAGNDMEKVSKTVTFFPSTSHLNFQGHQLFFHLYMKSFLLLICLSKAQTG